jgi:hypothetical protein
MPEARRIRAEADGGPLGGGAPRAVWLTLGSPAGAVSVQSAAQRLIGEHRPCHLIWDPATGEMAQLISVLRAGRALGAPDRLDWVPNQARRRPENVNAEGRVCAQIGVLALASEPFTGGPLIGVDSIMSWLDSWGVARRWPDGQPPAWPGGGKSGGKATSGGPGSGPGGGPGGGIGSRAAWARGGHFGASQVPGCGHAGPGAIDIHRLTGNGSHHGLSVSARDLSATLTAAPLPIPA